MRVLFFCGCCMRKWFDRKKKWLKIENKSAALKPCFSRTHIFFHLIDYIDRMELKHISC